MKRGRVPLGLLALLAGCQQAPETGNAAIPAPGPTATATPTPALAGIATLPPPQQQDAAFRAVFGRAGPVADKEGWTTKAEKLVWRGETAILITSKSQEDACHACSGSLGVYYLKPVGDGFTVTGRFAEAVSGNGFGGLPEWSISDKFGATPMIYAEAGWSGQGYTCTSFTLTELGAAAPRQLAQVPIYYSDKDTGSGATELTGKLGKIAPDREFTVDYSGSKAFAETWRRTAKGYALTGKTRMETC